MVKILADENIEAPIVNYLSNFGADVVYISKKLKGISDEEVLTIAQKDQRLIFTNDRDFAYKIYLENRFKNGVVLFRFDNQKTSVKLEALKRTLQIFSLEHLTGKFSVISEEGIKQMGSE